MPSFVNLSEGRIFAVGLPLAGNGKASTAPGLVVRINEYRAKSPVFFAIGGGVNGLVTRHSFDSTYVVRINEFRAIMRAFFAIIKYGK